MATARRVPPTRFAAFLRGVSPMNVRMPELAAAFEAAGFAGVHTVLSSGNVVFGAPAAPEAELERRAEAAMLARMDKAFGCFVRPVDALAALLASDPYAGLGVPPGAKRVVTFLRSPPRPAPGLPLARDGAAVLRVEGRLALSVYEPGPQGPVFMRLIEQAFGKDVTTRTWDTVARVVRAAGARPPAAARRRR